ncbi:cation-translocating P-type ATPase [Nocardiopsis baichengensis]|uniref:cation-translocating P-type ATPase n=1 Tax=Nocardiopsis baichengensis TaxID=280240 RepID=UPI000686624B|nr:HAD-IC family P-type ATPase [Nocardiopsis baichengensis]
MATPDTTSGTPLHARAHALSGAEVAEALAADRERGLTRDEAARRLAAFGANALPRTEGTGRLMRLLRQFHSPLVYVLLVAAAVTLAMGHFVDAGVISGVVVLNAAIGYVQEARAQRALDALARMVRVEAVAVRDGAARRLPAQDLVPGDLVVLQAGDRVPADLRIVGAEELETDESALTGESAPVAKSAEPVAPRTLLADRTAMAYSGTVTTRGTGRGIVVATGADTEVGAIDRLVGSADRHPTPLTRRLGVFSRRLTAVIVALAALTFAVGTLYGEAPDRMFTAAVALAVGAIPEGLPAAITIVLAIGAVRMARRNAVVRTLTAAETLGGTTVICTDKTGTLTTNEMTVVRVLAEGAAARACLLAGVLCSDAAPTGPDGRRAVGDPTETALLAAAQAQGLVPAQEAARAPRVGALPFTSERKLMATAHRGADGRLAGYVKGAPERVLVLCSRALGPDGREGALDAEGAEQVRRTAAEWAGQGLRVLAFARFAPERAGAVREDDLPGRLTLLGLQAMHDPPRPEAIEAVRACRAAGIGVRMLTGDHGATARAIADRFGIGGEVLVGDGIDAADEESLARAGVFARVSPEQKLRLVRLLQRRGEVVAMTGDGVNDAPALRQADIGVAMGRVGTDAAKEAADMVLADDDFATIEAAVEQGRGVFDNLRRFLAWTLPTNIGEGLVVMAAVLAGAVLPILPVQILWINMTTAGFLGLTLAFEPRSPETMRRPPRRPRAPVLSRDLVRRIVLVSLILVAGAFGVFHHALAGGAPVEEARTAAVNVFVVVEAAYLISCRSLERLLPHGPNRWVWAGITVMAVLQLLFTYTPVMNALFHTAPVAGSTWALVLAVGAAAYAAVETDKALWRRSDARRMWGADGGE